MKIFIKKYSVNFFLYATNSAVSGITNVLSVPFFISLFGINTYGKYSLILSVIYTLHCGIGGPLNQNMLRFGVINEGASRMNVSDIFIILIMVECIFGTILFFGMSFFFKDFYIGVLSGLILFSIGFFQLYQSYLQAQEKAKDTTILEIIRNLIFILSPFFLIKIFKGNGRELYYLLCGILFSHLVTSLLAVRKLTKLKIVNFNEGINLFTINKQSSIYQMGIKIWRFSLPLIGWFVFSNLLNIVDRYVIVYYLGYSEVGYYSAIYDLMYKGIVLLLTPILTVIYPLLVKYYEENDRIKVNNIMNIGFLIQMFLTIVAFVFMKSFEKYIVKTFLHGLFINDGVSQKLIYLIIIGSFFWQVGMLIHKKLELKRQTYKMLIAIIVAFSVNLSLNIFLIPHFGILAAGYNTIIGSVVYVSVILVFITDFRWLKLTFCTQRGK